MRLFLAFLVAVACARPTLAQTAQPIWTVDFVKTLPGKLDSAALSYNMNWGEARMYAQRMKFISSYRLLKLATGVANSSGKTNEAFNILLITEYPSRKAFDDREKNFKVVFDTYQPGWNLLAGKKPSDFATIQYDMVFTTLPPFLKGK